MAREEREDDRNFTFVEEHRDGAAFDAHLKTPHIKAGLARLLAEELDMRTYRLVG